MAGTKVVILGGGIGGLTLAQHLYGLPGADVKLVDGKSFFEIAWPGVRCPVEPQLADVSVVNYTDIPKLDFVHAKATGFDTHSVKLSTGQQLPYDVLVLAFGAAYADSRIVASEGTAEQRRQQYKNDNEKLKAASSVLIVGGGPLGVEMACEIASMGGKQVTLVQSGPALLAGQPPKVAARALSGVRRQGVEVILNDKAVPVEGRPGTFKLKTSGQELQADMAYFTGGIKPFSGWMKEQHSSCLDAAGYVKVGEDFRVEGHSNVFAFGDCCNIPEWKMGLQSKLQAEELAKSVRSIVKLGPEKATYTKHKPFCGMKVMAVTMGKNDAVLNAFGWNMPAFIPRFMKCKDLLIGQTRKDLGLPTVALPLPVATV